MSYAVAFGAVEPPWKSEWQALVTNQKGLLVAKPHVAPIVRERIGHWIVGVGANKAIGRVALCNPLTDADCKVSEATPTGQLFGQWWDEARAKKKTILIDLQQMTDVVAGRSIQGPPNNWASIIVVATADPAQIATRTSVTVADAMKDAILERPSGLPLFAVVAGVGAAAILAVVIAAR